MAKLRAAISSSDTILPILGYIDPSEFPKQGVVLIDSEHIKYELTTDKELAHCTRGYEGTTAVAHLNEATVELLTEVASGPVSASPVSTSEFYDDTHSHQTIAADLHISSAAGSSSDPKFIAAIMGNIFGSSLSKTKPYLAGVIGAYSINGAKSTTYPAGAVLAQISDGSTTADGAVVAYIDGDSAQTNANAAFTVRNNNSVPGSGFNYGLDLKGATHDGYPAVSYLLGEIRFSNGTKVTVSGDTIIFTNAAATKSFTITMV